MCLPMQELSLISELNDEQKEHIILCLSAGNISLIINDDEKLPENYELMRKFAQILLKDILKDRRSFVRRAFDVTNTQPEKSKKHSRTLKTKLTMILIPQLIKSNPCVTKLQPDFRIQFSTLTAALATMIY